MRLFVALALPEKVAGEIVALQGRVGAGRAVPEENLHLTLAFLGHVQGGQMADLDLALEAVQSPAPWVELAGVDLWEEALVIAARPDAVLERLAHKLATAVRGAGISLPRRRYRPHVTFQRMGRMAPGEAERVGRFLQARADAALSPFEARAFGLYRSHLRPEGALYELMAEYPLG